MNFAGIKQYHEILVEGMSFAVAINTAKEVIPDLKAGKSTFAPSTTPTSTLAVRPKPPFRPIFQMAASKADAEIRIINEPLDVLPKGSPVFLVETGESRTPRPEKATQDILQA